MFPIVAYFADGVKHIGVNSRRFGCLMGCILF